MVGEGQNRLQKYSRAAILRHVCRLWEFYNGAYSTIVFARGHFGPWKKDRMTVHQLS